MMISSRIVAARRVWTFEAGRWRISVMFSPRWTMSTGFHRDPSRFGFAGSVSLPFVCVTAFQRRKEVSRGTV